MHVELQVAGAEAAAALVDSGAAAFAFVPRPFGRSRGAPRFTPLYRDPMVALFPEGHRLAAGAHVDLADLAGESILVGNDACAYRALLVGALRESDIDVALRARFGDASTLAYGVAAGLGIAVLPAGFFATGASPPGTVALALQRPRIAIEIGVVQPCPLAPESEPERALRQALVAALRR